MKKILFLVMLCSFVYGGEKFQSIQPKELMDWDRAVGYCFYLGGRLPNIEQMEKAFAYKSKGVSIEYLSTTYWTRNNISMDSAISFNFDIGLSFIDHKALRYKVMCVR